MSLHTEKPGTIVTGVANGAITKRRFIGYDDAVCAVKGMLAKGVSRDEDQDTGKSFAITIDGTALVEAGGALSKGDNVTTNALGKAVIAGKGEYINGIVMRDQLTVGQDVEIRLGGNMISTVPTTTSTTTTTTSSSSSTTTSTAA
jgi:hypothetical protein